MTPSPGANSPVGEIVVRAVDLSRSGEEEHSSVSLPSTPRRRNGGPFTRAKSPWTAPSLRTAGTSSPRGSSGSRTRSRCRHLGARPDRQGTSSTDLRAERASLLGERWPAGHYRCEDGPDYRTFETWRVNADGTGRTRLPIPEADLVLDCSRDGTWLATRTIGGEPAHKGRLTLVHPDGTGARYLTEGSANDDLFLHIQDLPGWPARRLRRDQDRAKRPTCQTLRRRYRWPAPPRDPDRFEPGMPLSPDGRPTDLGWHD